MTARPAPKPIAPRPKPVLGVLVDWGNGVKIGVAVGFGITTICVSTWPVPGDNCGPVPAPIAPALGVTVSNWKKPEAGVVVACIAMMATGVDSESKITGVLVTSGVTVFVGKIVLVAMTVAVSVAIETNAVA